MTKKDPSTTHYEHSQLVLLGDIASSLDRIADLLEQMSDRQGVQANALLQLADEHGSTVPGPF
jgi:hypothetical protein